MNIIVYGPKACGKTINKDLLLQQLNCTQAFDSQTLKQVKRYFTELPIENRLLITHETPTKYFLDRSDMFMCISFLDYVKQCPHLRRKIPGVYLANDIQNMGNLAESTVLKAIDNLYNRGWIDKVNSKDYDPRGTWEWQIIYDLIKELS